jgi:hypothetical protein
MKENVVKYGRMKEECSTKDKPQTEAKANGFFNVLYSICLLCQEKRTDSYLK